MIWSIVIAALGWSLFLIQRYGRSDSLAFPPLFSEMSPEERRVREQLTDAESMIEDLRMRLKLAVQDKERETRQLRLDLWQARKVNRDALRVLERGGEPGPEPEMETVGRAG